MNYWYCSLSNVSLTSGKPEDMLWFHRAVTMSQILRYLTYGEKQGEQFTNDAVADATQALSTPMAYTRLLVISGIHLLLSFLFLRPYFCAIAAIRTVKIMIFMLGKQLCSQFLLL